jgi:hypothetical protein
MNTALNSLPKTVREMLSSYGEEFYTWQAESVESGGCARPGSDSRDRFNRCYEAAADGGDGSTHAEHIEDFREFGADLFEDAHRAILNEDLSDAELEVMESALEAAQASYMADCDELEAWHKANGSLDHEVG